MTSKKLSKLCDVIYGLPLTDYIYKSISVVTFKSTVATCGEWQQCWTPLHHCFDFKYDPHFVSAPAKPKTFAYFKCGNK